jgi:hypothetical protein
MNQGRWGHELVLLWASATARAAFTFPNQSLWPGASGSNLQQPNPLGDSEGAERLY